MRSGDFKRFNATTPKASCFFVKVFSVVFVFGEIIRVNDLGIRNGKPVFFGQVREMRFYVFAAGHDSFVVFDHNPFTVGPKELAEEFDGTPLSAVIPLLFKVPCAACCQVGTGREGNDHIPFAVDEVFHAVHCVKRLDSVVFM